MLNARYPDGTRFECAFENRQHTKKWNISLVFVCLEIVRCVMLKIVLFVCVFFYCFLLFSSKTSFYRSLRWCSWLKFKWLFSKVSILKIYADRLHFSLGPHLKWLEPAFELGCESNWMAYTKCMYIYDHHFKYLCLLWEIISSFAQCQVVLSASIVAAALAVHNFHVWDGYKWKQQKSLPSHPMYI